MLSRIGWKRIAGALVGVMLLAGTAIPSAAATHAHQTVRVGFFAFDGYHMVDETGRRSGYGYEFLQHLAGYTDWRYEYVGYDRSWNEMQEMLARGEIDLLTSAQKTPERQERFDFSDEPIGTSSAVLTVKAGNTVYAPDDYADWSGMRVGMIAGNSRNDSFTQFAAEKGFTYVPVLFDSADEMADALTDGQSIDAVLTSNLRTIDGEWVLAEFDASPFYIMVRKGDAALLDQINDALAQLNSDEPELVGTLMAKYYTPNSGDEVAFTLAERHFIKETQGTEFTAVICPDRAPYSFFQDGQPAGICVEIVKLVAQRSKLNIRFVETKDRAEYRRLIDTGAVDVCFDAPYDYPIAERTGYRLTAPYLDTSISSLRRRNGPDAVSLAGLLADSPIAERFEDDLIRQGVALTYYDSTEQLVEALKKGAVDTAYLFRRSAAYAARTDVRNSLIAEEIYGYDMSFAAAVNAEADPMLFSVLNKAVASVRLGDAEAINRQYSADTETPFSLIGYMYDYPLHVVLTFFAVVLITLLILWLVSQYRRRKRTQEQIEREQARSEELLQALQAAERADIAKNQFLSSMSHEIRTPLNAVIGYNSIARNELVEAKTDEQRRQADMHIMDCLSKSELASKHLLNLVNDVLDMSAIENGRMRVAHEPFDFSAMIGSLTMLFFSQARAKGVEFEVQFDSPTEEWFIGDQMRINQILTNLLGNAVKFTPEGGTVTLGVTQRTLSETETGVRFTVRDTGIGMTQEYMTRIWTPFEQAEASISRRFGGTGLGLSITKNLVDLMGGTIAVESESGAGTLFTVELKLTRMEQPEKEETYDFSGIRALVVDDDAATCEYIKLLFDRCGATCLTVQSGAEAVETFSSAKAMETPFNVCLVDWRMPQMDGLETVKRIRGIADREMPIIIVTAYDFSEISEKAEEAGVNMFVSKPLFQSSLFDLLANISGTQNNRLERSTKFDFRGARVLLVEDNKMNMEVAMRILASSGLTVDCAWNGREAVEKFTSAKKGTYAAILMDVHMPEVDGYEATRQIRASAHPEAATVPIIAMTADAFTEDIQQAHASGMNDHVAKPIDIAVLFGVLKKYIRSAV